jgi:site-specific recombinase XerD
VEEYMKLSPCIHQFFDQYLFHIRGMSHNTIQSYRDTFKLFLPFAAKHYGIKIKSLRIEHVSSTLIIAFLNELQEERKNLPKTRNSRLAAIKSFAKMIRLMYPEHRKLADTILDIPQKRFLKTIIGFLYPEEILQVFQSVDLKRKEGFRDYTILHLLYDSGARASEIATLNLDYFNPKEKTLLIRGKGNRHRLIQLENKTIQLLQLYIRQYRKTPKLQYRHRIFINQRGEEFTRHGIFRICNKYLTKTLNAKRLKYISSVHSLRHSRAVNMLYRGCNLTEIMNRLGHDNLKTTSIYLQLDLRHRRDIQKKLIRYFESILTLDPKIEKLIGLENDDDLMKWLDNL